MLVGPVNIPPELLGYGVIGLLVTVGVIVKSGIIRLKWPEKSDPRLDGRRSPVSHDELTAALNELRGSLAMAVAEAKDAKAAAAAASQSVLSVSQLIEQSMQNVTDRFASSLDKLDQLTIRMLGRLDATEVNVAKAMAATSAVQNSQTAFEARLQGIETTLRDK